QGKAYKMKLTTKGRYAVTAILELALTIDQHLTPVTLTYIAKTQHISLAYLEQIFLQLRRAELVKSTRGAKGGYLLNKRIDQITIEMIINAVHEKITSKGCDDNNGCNCTSHCLTHDLWTDLDNHIHDYLSKITLKDLLTQNHNARNELLKNNSLRII
ncbi:MAG: Rrf2 family transcriptional regulator, partial [Psittacicella sp.]